MSAQVTKAGATRDQAEPKQASITLLIRTNPELAIVIFFGFFWAIAVVACPFYAPPRAFVTLGLAFGASAVGAFPGFLFGLPKSNNATNTGSAGGDALSMAPSTGLEQIADWLTKIIVGAGLVELKSILPWFGGLCTSVAAEYSSTPPSPTFVGGWTLFFVVVSFIAAYNLTRVYLSPVYRDLEKLVRERVAPVERERDETNERMRAIAGEGIRQLNPGADFTASNGPASAVTIKPGTDPEDPCKGQFDGLSERNGYRLSARFLPVKPSTSKSGTAVLSVESTQDGKKFEGTVVFYLHPTFDVPIVRVPINGGRAEMRITLWGGFTVGAVTPDGTKLELDLSELPDAPPFVREL